MNEDQRFQRTDGLLDAALELPSQERGAFLDRECGGDAELRARVQVLLGHAEATATGWLKPGGASGALPDAFGRQAPSLAGTTLGRYRVLREIGRGGMGVVYEAEDTTLERTVAIKVLPARAPDERARERFLREARAAAALNHPNIVALHDAGEAQGWPFLVMEYVPGSGLDEQPPTSLDEALEIARQICDALEHAHARGLVHRDLKPANVLVTRQGDRPRAKLTDLGIALTRCGARVTLTGAIAGTPTYMAPEQALGQRVDGRADLYSLGVMLYAWSAGRPPFEGDDALSIVSQHIHAPVVPPRTYRPDLPAGLEPLVLKLLSKTPEGRIGSAAEVRQLLDTVGTETARASRTDRVAIEGLTRGRMVGRQRELERLQELWRAAVAGRSHVALISGEPGVGKTRLARELTAVAQLDGAPVLTGGCYENEATTPYLPFVEAFRRLVRERDDTELRAALGDSASEIARLAPEIGSRLGPFPDGPTLSPQEERLRLFDHVARFLSQLAGKRGLLLFFDDLQWADHGSLALLHYLLRQLETVRILFLGTYREVELDRAHGLSKALVDWNRERHATRLRLDRLCREDTAHMIRTLLDQQDVSPKFVLSVHRETEGNPFFVEEIVKALIAEGDLVRERMTWRRQSTGEFVLPQSVKAAIGSRLQRVGDSCSEVLRVAAVLGKAFDFAELVSIARRDEDELLDVLDEAVATQLIAPARGESFVFTHDKIREVLYEELNPIRRRRLHARIAEGLERLHDKNASVAVEDLAHHFVQSGDYEKGLLYADRAAEAARRVFAHEEALEMLARARECAEELERDDDIRRIDETMGDVTLADGEVVGAAKHYERALVAAGDTERNELRCKLGEVYAVVGDPRGLEHVRATLEELDAESHPGVAAQAMVIEARFLHLDGKLQRAAEIYRHAIELVRPLGNPALLIRIHGFLSGTLQHQGELRESDEAARHCIEIGEQEGLHNGVLLGHEFLCENAIYRGRWQQSIEHGELEEALAREVHAGERHGWSQFRAWGLLALGRLAEAARLARQEVDRCERTGDKRLGLFMTLVQAECLLETGRTGEASKLARRVLQEADQAQLLSHRIVARAHLVRTLMRLGRDNEAMSEALKAIELWQTSGSQGLGLLYGAVCAEALWRGGRVEQARALLDTHAELAHRNDAEHRIAQNQRVRGLLALHDDELDEALVLLDDAANRFEACGSTIALAGTLAERAALQLRRRQPQAAEADRARERELLDRCGVGPERPGPGTREDPAG